MRIKPKANRKPSIGAANTTHFDSLTIHTYIHFFGYFCKSIAK